MRRELLTFSVDPPFEVPEADPDVGRLLTRLLRDGGAVEAVFPGEAGDELAVVVALDDEAPVPDADAVLPRLRLRSRRVHPRAPRPVAVPAVPPLVEPDPTLVDPRPTRWHSVEIEPGGTAVVTYLRGIVHRLHSVEVSDSPGGVRISVLLGRDPSVPPGSPVLAVGIAERTRVRLPFAVS